MRAMCLVLMMSAGTGLWAQMLVEPARLPERLRSFDKREGEARLNCSVRPLKPSLNLGFRFQTGVSLEVPMKQFGGRETPLAMAIRVTPEGSVAQASWLATRVRVPATEEKRAVAELAGSYIVGEGKYRVDMVLADDKGRACTSGWSIRAELSDRIRNVRPGLPAGTVDDLSMRKSRRAAGTAEPDRYTVSILLHASATSPNRLRLRDYDRMLLLSALSSMADRLPAKIRLTVFSMDNPTEVFHTDELSRESFGQAMQALNEVELGKVDYATLQNRSGHLELLARLLNREARATNRPDAVVVIGPLAHSERRISDEELGDGSGAPPVYYVQLRPWRMAGAWTDSISKAVSQLGGKTRAVYSPEDFAAALQDIDRLLRRGEPAGVGAASDE